MLEWLMKKTYVKGTVPLLAAEGGGDCPLYPNYALSIQASII
jgi:hypothetical protein